MYKKNLQSVHDAMKQLAVDGELDDVSYEQIAAEAETSRRSVARAISELIAQGKVRRIHAKGRSVTNLYEVKP